MEGIIQHGQEGLFEKGNVTNEESQQCSGAEPSRQKEKQVQMTWSREWAPYIQRRKKEFTVVKEEVWEPWCDGETGKKSQTRWSPGHAEAADS